VYLEFKRDLNLEEGETIDTEINQVDTIISEQRNSEIRPKKKHFRN